MAPSDRARRSATYADLLALPEHVVGEIIDGELHVSPRPSPRHALASSVLGGELGPPYHGGRGGPGGWWILDEPELHFGPDVLVPDLAGWRRSRMPSLPKDAFFTIPPEWVCEVLSPATARLDRLKKLRVYAREGVSYLWLIDPVQKTLEVMQLENARWTLLIVHGGSDLIRAAPFTEVEIALGSLWESGE